MRWPWNRRKENDAIDAARQEVQKSEQRLGEARALQRSLIEMIAENHVKGRIDNLINGQRKGRDGDPGTSPSGSR